MTLKKILFSVLLTFCFSTLNAQDSLVKYELKATAIPYINLTDSQRKSLRTSPRLKRIATYNPETNRFKARKGFRLFKIDVDGVSITLLTNDGVTESDIQLSFDRWPNDIHLKDGRVFAVLCLCEISGDTKTDDCQYDKQEMKRGMRSCHGTCGCTESDSEILKPKPSDDEEAETEGTGDKKSE